MMPGRFLPDLLFAVLLVLSLLLIVVGATSLQYGHTVRAAILMLIGSSGYAFLFWEFRRKWRGPKVKETMPKSLEEFA